MNFTWTFPQFIVNPTSDGLTNVVTAINWICTGSGNGITASNSGTVKLGTPNPAEFIPYADITQDMAYMWVSQNISMPSVEKAIAQQIENLSQPVAQSQSPPFS